MKAGERMVLWHRRERIKQTNVLPRCYKIYMQRTDSARTLEAPGLLDYTAHEFVTIYIWSICLGPDQMTATDLRV